MAEEANNTSGIEELSDDLLMFKTKKKSTRSFLGRVQSIGELQPHVTIRGPNMGETSIKKQWQHHHLN